MRMKKKKKKKYTDQSCKTYKEPSANQKSTGCDLFKPFSQLESHQLILQASGPICF